MEKSILNNKFKKIKDLKIINELYGLFKNNGFELYLVGGSVRDALLGIDLKDLDFTTNAKPEDISEIVRKWSDGMWETGAPYGTISIKKNIYTLEITTYRKDVYRHESRKPEVTFSDSLEEDLIRRDFTINSIALDLSNNKLIDPFGGQEDLKNKLLKTADDPEKSFSDDPLRMMRACRFTSTLCVEPTKELLKSIKDNKERLSIISTERIRDELSRLLLGKNPASGLQIMVVCGLAGYIIPEIPKLKLTQEPGYKHKDVLYHTYLVVNSIEPDLISRLAALLHDIAKPKTKKIIKGGVHFYGHDIIGAKMAKKRLEELKYPKNIIKNVTELIRLHLRPYTYAMGWTDSAVRRYVRDAGELLPRLNEFAVADCTTAVPEKAKKNLELIKELEERIKKLEEEEEISKIRAPLNGDEVINYLKVKPGPVIGEAMDMLLEATLDGEIKNKDEAYSLLSKWVKKNKLL